MKSLPTYWFKTSEFWLGQSYKLIISAFGAYLVETGPGYPHWDMQAELKRYYLMQFSYWLQQLLVLVLGLEKARKDYSELVTHHFITLWLIG